MGLKSENQRKAAKPLRIGFVPLCDCAPLIIAQELGLFARYGLRVELSREIGWATLRDKILYGELEAAHALAPMVFAATLGLDSPPVDCLTGLVLNLHGNAITVAEQWFDECKGGEDWQQSLARRDRFILGIPFLHSSHQFIARAWLRTLVPRAERIAQFVVVPPPQMPANLKAGHLDGYCVGEPWNSVAALAGFGRIVATSAEIAPLHPEKVLMVRRSFAEERAEEHEQLIAALIAACRFCDASQNREQVIETLARGQYLNTSAAALRAGLTGDMVRKSGITRQKDFTIFARDNANEPSGRKAAWILENFRQAGICKDASVLSFALARKVFRADLFERALRLANPVANNDQHEIESNKTTVLA